MTVNVVTVIGYNDEEQSSDKIHNPTYLEAQVETAGTPYVVTSTTCRDGAEAQEVVVAYNNAPHGSVDLDTVRSNIRQ